MVIKPKTIGTPLLPLLVLAGYPLAAQMREQAWIPQVLGERGRAGAARSAADWTIEIRPAPGLDMPGPVDSNSPAYWSGGELYLINSTGSARVSHGADQAHLN